MGYTESIIIAGSPDQSLRQPGELEEDRSCSYNAFFIWKPVYVFVTYILYCLLSMLFRDRDLGNAVETVGKV